MTIMRSVSTSSLAFLTLLTFVHASPPQAGKENQSGVTTLKVTSRLVMVDVVATDSQGHPIIDLKPADFTVLEDGHPQAIKAFSLDSPERRALEIQNSPTRQLPQGVFTNMPEFQPATAPPTILLLDGLNTPFQDQVQAKKMMIRVLQKLDAHSKVAVYLLTSQLRLLQNFTSDTTLLLAAINRLHPVDSRAFNNAREAVALPQQELPSINVPNTAGAGQVIRDQNLDSPDNVLNRMQDTVKTFEAEQQEYKDTFRAGRTLEALKAIARATQGYVGRKNLIWISGSFPFSVLPDPTISAPHKAEHSYEKEVTRTASLLTDSQIAMYPIQAIGLAHTMGDASFAGHDAYRDVVRGGGSTAEMRRLSSDEFNATSSMETLADETGGRAYRNRNDIDGAVLSSLADGSTYYTLAYTPENPKYDGRFRTVQVKVDRPGIRLRHRKGYYADNPNADLEGQQSKGKDLAPELRSALVFDPMPATGVGFFARVLPVQKDNKFAFDIRVDASNLLFEPGKNGQEQTRLELAAAAFDAENRPTAFESYSITAPLSKDQFSEIQKTGLPFQFKMAYDSKVKRVRLAIRDNAAGTLGTVDVDVRGLTK